MTDKVQVFIAFAREDEAQLKVLENHLQALGRLITIWHEGKIIGGMNTENEINRHFEAASLILLLVTANFIASDKCNQLAERAVEKNKQKNVRVIPVLLQEVFWEYATFSYLAPLPSDRRAITSWQDRNAAYLDVVKGVHKNVVEINGSSPTPSNANSHKEQQTMSQDKEFDVFLCHNNKDKPQVIEIAEQLKERGIVPWLDVWELPPGQRWQPLLEKQIGEIKSAAVFVGPSGFGPWQQEELDAFLRQFVSRHCPVIPVLLKGASEKPELPPFLAGFTWVDFHKIQPDPMFQLIWGITGKKPNAVRSVGVEAKGGGSGSPIPNPAPVSTSTSRMSLSGLSRQQKAELVDKLLACPTMRDRHTRDTVAQELSFASAISRHTADRVDVTNIMNTSLNYQDGLRDLVEEVGNFEKDALGNDSLPMQQLRVFVDSLS